MTDNLPATAETLLKGLTTTHAAAKTSAGSSGDMYIRLQKDGIWAFGPESLEVEEESQWAVDPNSFVQGYIAWQSDPDKPAEKLGEVMRAATDAPVDPTTLPEVAGRWDHQMGFSMLCMNGEDEGTRVIYTTTSKGGLRAVTEVLGELIKRLQGGETDAIIPVVKLQTDSYKHKKYGKVYVPVVSVERWARMSDTVMEAKQQIEQQTAEEPAPEPEPEPTRTTRRRRRRAAA